MRRWAQSVNFKCAFEKTPPEQGGIQILGSAEKFSAESRHDWSCVPSEQFIGFSCLCVGEGGRLESTVLEYSVFLFQPFFAQTEHTRCVLYSVVLPLPVSNAVSSSKFDLFDPPSHAGTFEG